MRNNTLEHQSEGPRPPRSGSGGDDDELDELLELLERDGDQRSFAAQVGRQPGAILVVVVNLVPALLALALEWDPFAIVLLYWFENGIIGLFNVLRIAFAAPRLRTQADVLVGIFQTGIFRFPPITRSFVARAQRRPAGRIPAARSFALSLFLLTFPVFMALHALLLFRLFEGVGPSGVLLALKSHVTAGLAVALGVLAIEHVWLFGDEFVHRRGYRRTIPLLQAVQPYPKLAVIHLALLAGALVGRLLPVPAVTAVALVVLKTALDLGLILRIRIKPSGLREMLAADDEDDEPQRPQTEEAAPRATDRLASGPEDCSLLLSLPRPGIRATSRRFGSGLLATSLAFTLIGGMLFVLFGLVPIAMLVKSGLGFESVWVFVAPVFGVPIGGLLIAAGLYSLSTALRVGCARAEIRVREGELEIIERGLLGRRRVLFSRDEVELIDVAKSGAAVNNVPFWLLELRRRGGEPALELLYGRPEKELREVAHKLRRTLRLGPPDDVRR